MKGKLIVIEGLDGSGKATQTMLLYETLAQEMSNVKTLNFPCYDEESSALVRMYLGGEFGDKPDDVNGYAASVFFAVDRYASYKKHWQSDYENGAILLANRYTTSNAVFQTGKLPQPQWDGYIDWLFDFEYNLMEIPAPDLVIYLDITPETGLALMDKRYTGDENKKDIHERDTAYQQRSRQAALYCAQKQNWAVVSCDGAGKMRPQQDIANEILDIVRKVVQ